MNNQELKILTQTTSNLCAINHPDAYRIAKEICEFTNFNSDTIDHILSQLKENKPWEYIRGWSMFKGLKIKVTASTLIPRIESEQLVDIVLKNVNESILQIIDVGTGSGAIGMAIKKALPTLEVIGIDISEEALEIAKENSKENGVDITYVESDLLSSFKITKPSIIVANLPYIPHSDYLQLDSSVKDYEPSSALDGGEEGLDYIYRLIDECRGNENVSHIYLEIDPSQEKLIQEKYPEIKITSFNDYQGLVRFLKLDL